MAKDIRSVIRDRQAFLRGLKKPLYRTLNYLNQSLREIDRILSRKTQYPTQEDIARILKTLNQVDQQLEETVTEVEKGYAE
jgi:predicted ATP-dependent protease